jgi:hypothetical protein
MGSFREPPKPEQSELLSRLSQTEDSFEFAPAMRPGTFHWVKLRAGVPCVKPSVSGKYESLIVQKLGFPPPHFVSW